MNVLRGRRFEVFVALTDREVDVTTLANGLELAIADVGKCLKSLHTAGLLKIERNRIRHIYSHSDAVHCQVEGRHVVIDFQTGSSDRFQCETAQVRLTMSAAATEAG